MQKIIITQNPEPGRAIVMFCGDTITFTLKVEIIDTNAEDSNASLLIDGEAWIRTNLGKVAVSRREIIDKVDHDEIRLNEAWHDIKMVKSNSRFNLINSENSFNPADSFSSEDSSYLTFSITLPLIETGHFQAKCFFLENGRTTPLWSFGENCTINVDSAGSCSSNIIYNAFVRQFGKTKETMLPNVYEEQALSLLDSKAYTVIPPSGRFRDLIKELDFIFKELGCRIIQLLPIHPTPTTYGRMGRYGSPYASLNFTEVDPALAEFDKSATPLEQFIELVDAVHFYSGYLILDIAINHTGWASSIHEQHPEWLARQEDGTIEVPGAWGVKWEDLTRLDYSKKELWQYMADMFLLWCKRGVDGFRCDAGYMIPVQAWEYIAARVRQEYPDTIFFLEGLGGSVDATCNLLNHANLNWAYSELFQNYDRNQIESYLIKSIEISEKYGLMVNFAETHDNLRLASVSKVYAKMRTSICALLSVSGSFGFTAGVEWFAKDKINVHESPSLNWGAEENQIEHIKRLNHILKTHLTFTQNTDLEFIHVPPLIELSSETGQKTDQSNQKITTPNYSCIALLRNHTPTESRLLILANLDCQNPQTIFFNIKNSAFNRDEIYDLLTDRKIEINTKGDIGFLKLMAGEVAALQLESSYSLENSYIKSHQSFSAKWLPADLDIPINVLSQKFKAKVLNILAALKGYEDITLGADRCFDLEETVNKGFGLKETVNKGFGLKETVNKGFNLNKAAENLYKNPMEFCRSFNNLSKESRVVVWKWGRDNKRVVMIPPDFFIMVIAPAHFRADIKTTHIQRAKEITIGYEESLPMQNGGFFALFMPVPQSELISQSKQTSQFELNKNNILLYNKNNKFYSEYTIKIRIFINKKAQESESSLIYLTQPDSFSLNREFTRQEIIKEPSLKLLGFNKKGAMMRAAAWWGRLDSKYDALLAANINPDYPENRWVLLSRYRIWAVYQGYSRELTLNCLERFTFFYNDNNSHLSSDNHLSSNSYLGNDSHLYSNIGRWLFKVPTCEGNYFEIEITLGMVKYKNQVVMKIYRKDADSTAVSKQDLEPMFISKQDLEPMAVLKKRKENIFSDDKKIEIIIRPDIESRSFHDTVKAWTGPEHKWRDAIKSTDNGFIFNPEENRSLQVQISSGKFIFEPEWQYMVYHPLEAERGLDPHSDLFSPGYFKAALKGGGAVLVNAAVPVFEKNKIDINLSSNNFSKLPNDFNDIITSLPNDFNNTISSLSTILNFRDAVKNSIDAFIVEREHHKSVIAGYPWFLDWGRDSLIFCRALIEDGRFSHAKDILRLFGRFEHDGTLPNMICGDDAGNRETSDAPLWFFAACRELAEKEGYAFLDEKIDDENSYDAAVDNKNINDKRTFREVLISMAHSFIKGTYTGMGIDPETNLFYSPSHFTWMDTNFPACSPRQGYPVEIQALWFYALVFLSKIDDSDSQKKMWQNMALEVQKSVIKLFYIEKDGFFSDCLHCVSRKSALHASPDNALRPNQLFLITLGVLTGQDYYKSPFQNSIGEFNNNQNIGIKTLESCMELLVPGAIRSLADRKVSLPLHIYHKYPAKSGDNITLLNDPCNPYFGTYKGDEDTKRKPAYHNGTAWTWQFPIFCEAWAEVFGLKAIDTALSWLGSSLLLLRKGCVGYVPEILDGDAPHNPRGCDAQAWGSSEILRVLLKLEKKGK